MKVAIYARVSKEDQAEQDPENQLVPLRQFCQGMSWEVKKEYIDRCSGGDSNRPAFQEMLSHVRQRHYDLVLVWALDRFSREGIHQTLGYIEQLKQHNVALKSYQEGWLDTRQSGVAELLIGIMAWIAAEERKRISERTKASLNRLKLEGRKLGRPRKVPPSS